MKSLTYSNAKTEVNEIASMSSIGSIKAKLPISGLRTLQFLMLTLIVSQVLLLSRPVKAQVLNWDSSPLNYNNSPLNYDNSSLNYNNSPLNYNNSPLNYSATNGVYDNSGNRIGYQTQSPTGVTNVFDNNGNRIGYSPAPNPSGSR